MHSYIDKDLGEVVLKPNTRAKRVIFRKMANHFSVTYPQGVNISRVKQIVEEEKNNLMKMRGVQLIPFTLDSTFSTYTFTVKIVKKDIHSCCEASLKDGLLHVYVPSDINIDDDRVQESIRSLIESGLRHEAKRILPNIICELANKHGFTYNLVKINKSRTRWGSCSSEKNINLSYFVLLLPEHLIKNIILHELCHTVEMNHSERFWKLLDSCTNNRAKELDQELKIYRGGGVQYLFAGMES